MLSYRDTHLLNPNEVERLNIVAFNFEAQFNGLSYADHKLIERTGLGMAAPQGRNGCYVLAFLVPLNDYTELLSHIRSPQAFDEVGS